jgi:hypothetical protein
MQWLYVYFFVAILLDHAHLVCPIWLGWSNRGFRQVMLARPEKFILLPALCVVGALLIGEHVVTTRDPIFRTLVAVYLLWNAWHFGSQHFGVVSLLGWRSGPRWLRQAIIIGPTMALMLVPSSLFPLMLLNQLFNFAHWTTDIGLTTWGIRRWWFFLPVVLATGFIGFVWKTVGIDPYTGIPAPLLRSIPILLALRIGIGFWHFLMSRWVWKLSHPQVRGTIGRNLFSDPQ